MEIQQLKHLLAAVQYGNLLKAAEACNITQSGLSRSISSLELRLGVPLLVRTPKGVEPTVFGLSVMERGKIILNEVTRSLEEVRAIESGGVGEITLGITQNYALYLIPALLAEMQASHPNLRFTIVTGGFLDLVERVANGSIEVAFGLLGRIDPCDDLIIEPLRDHYARVIARTRHPLAANPSITVQDLAAARWATLNGEGFQRNFTRFFEVNSLPPPAQVLRTDSIDLLRRFVLHADALTVLPADVVHAEIDAGTLLILDCDTPAEITQLGLIYRVGSLVTPQVKLVANRIKQIVAPGLGTR